MSLYILYITSEMGPGWNATVFIKNPLEDDFIRDAQRGFRDLRNYFIGGKTSRTPGEVFEYRWYNTSGLLNSYTYEAAFRHSYSEKYDGKNPIRGFHKHTTLTIMPILASEALMDEIK